MSFLDPIILDPINEWPPTRGPNGSPVVSSVLSGHQHITTHHTLPPSPPSRTLYLFAEDEDEDEDGNLPIIGTRELSDAEFEFLTAAYEKAKAEFERTGGVHLEAGPVTHTVKVVCADGSTGTASGDGKRGRWVDWRQAKP